MARPVRDLMQDLLSEVSDISQTIDRDSNTSRQISDNLYSLSNNISNSLDSLQYMQELHQMQLLDAYTSLKNSIVERLNLLSKEISESQEEAAIINAYLTSNWINQANDPQTIMAKRWVNVVVFLAESYKKDRTYSVDEMTDELILMNIPGDMARVMVNKLITKGLIVLKNAKYILDKENETFIKAKNAINAGNLINLT